MKVQAFLVYHLVGELNPDIEFVFLEKLNGQVLF